MASKYGTGRYTARIDAFDGERRAVRAEDGGSAFAAFAAAGHPVKLTCWEHDVNGDHTRGDLIKWYKLSAAAYAAFDIMSDGKVPAKVNGNITNGLYNKGLTTSSNERLASLTRAGWLLAAAYAEAEGHTDLAEDFRNRAEAARVELAKDL